MNSPGSENLRMLARYHRWAGRVLLEHLEPFSDDVWYRDEGLFFQSIHATLNHLLLVDRLWPGRLREEPIPFNGLDEILEPEREGLIRALEAEWQRIIDYVDSLDDEAAAGLARFRDSQGIERQMPRGPLLQHLANHGTHHRGQISAVITRLGGTAPPMDLGYYLYELAEQGDQ